jgi:nitrate/nitrite-specific signal transduction histidine kinase
LLLVYFLVALIAIGTTLLVSLRLEGGAAAINDAGSERMRSYRIAYLLQQQVENPSAELLGDIRHEMALFEMTLNELVHGNPHRPLYLPKDQHVNAQMIRLIHFWQADIKPHIESIINISDAAKQQAELARYRPLLEQYVAGINELVIMVEHNNAHAASLLRYLQIALLILAVVGTISLLYLFSHMVVRPILQLRQGISRMATADFDVRVPVTSQDEFGELAIGFNRMADELRDIYATLEQRVEEKTHSIEAKNRELAALDKAMAISEERNLFAQELHDSIAQSLAFLNIQIQMLQEDLQKDRIAEALKGLAQIREGVQDSYDDVRELMLHFRTRIGSTDLQTAIRSALEKFAGHTGIKADFDIHGNVPDFLPEQVLQIMHIVQESLSNARKHAKASQIKIVLNGADPCVIDIYDNGVGFDVSNDAGDDHVGLRIMRERAQKIGAELIFESGKAKGTHISLILAENRG